MPVEESNSVSDEVFLMTLGFIKSLSSLKRVPSLTVIDHSLKTGIHFLESKNGKETKRNLSNRLQTVQALIE